MFFMMFLAFCVASLALGRFGLSFRVLYFFALVFIIFYIVLACFVALVRLGFVVV